MDLHPTDGDLLDGPDFDLPPEIPALTKSDGMLQTPSPVSDEIGHYTGAKIRYSAHEKSKSNGTFARRIPEKVTRIRYDINISFRTPGQKVIAEKTPKTCVAQFCIMRDPQAYEDTEFYKTTVTRAKEELKKVTPFSTLQSFQGPWMPEIKFQKPAFKYANTDITCAYFDTYPSMADIQFMMEPFEFGTAEKVPHYKFYIIFDCDISTKIQLQPIKLENTELPTKDAQTNSDFNEPTNTLIENAEKAISTMNVDVQRATSDWFNALVQYRDQKAAISPPEESTIRPQPYRQALPDEKHQQKPRLTVVEHGKPNLQIQIKEGTREVFHTPDTTGTPQPMVHEETFPMIGTLPNLTYHQQVQPQIPHQVAPQNAVPLTPHMFFNMCMQQQQPQPQMQQPQVQLQQQQQLPMHQRLGPRTPPISQTPPPLPPKKRPHPLGPREHRRQHLQPEHRQSRERHQWRPHWERESRHSHSDYHDEDDDERRRHRSRSRSPSRPRSREPYHHRDPRKNPPPYRPRGKIRQTFPPQRKNKPIRTAQYGDYKQQMRQQQLQLQQQQQEDQHQPPPPDPAQFTEYAKILNITPEKMCEAYQVLQKAQERP